jgi:crotonobetainyl-CoA:carnitine CoA-transferase CaiB-like acyl-CoA transferase
VAGWVGAQRRDGLLSVLDEARIPAAPVNDLASIWDDPHVRARRSLVSVSGTGDDPLVFVAPAPRLGATPGTVAAPGPALGAHTAEVYREWLGLHDAELAGLRDRHVI